jgi:hypothetical protein
MWALFDQMNEELKVEEQKTQKEPVAVSCVHDFCCDYDVYVCRKCFCISKTMIDYQLPHAQKSDPVSQPYKRLTHFRSNLTRLLGLESYVLPDKVLSVVKEQNPSSIKHVKLILKQNGFSKFYKHCFSIASLCGLRLPQLSKSEIESLVFLFNVFNGEYQKNTKRSNQLSYHFLLGKLLMMIGRSDVVKFLNRLKSKSKLAEHEAIWLRCSDCFK